MSYCRFVEADVYIYMSVIGELRCCWCPMRSDDEGDFWTKSTEEMIAHIKEHQSVGHYVPADVIPALRRDDAENFPAVTP